MPSIYRLIAVAQLSALVASTSTTYSQTSDYDWVADSLPDCFQQCLEKTDESCISQQCICNASQDEAYLTTAVECVRDKCEKKALEINVALLVPAQIYCSAVGNSIPSESLKSAFECAMGGNVPTSTHKSASPTSRQQQSETDFKSTVTSTFALSTTDNEGHTIILKQPVAMGPDTISTGSIVTSTIESSSSSSTNPASTSASASPSQSAQTSSAASTRSSPSGTPSPTRGADNGGGSPFVNMQAAGAAQWDFSGPVIALSLIAGILVRL